MKGNFFFRAWGCGAEKKVYLQLLEMTLKLDSIMKTRLTLLVAGLVATALGAMAKVPVRAIPFILDAHL